MNCCHGRCSLTRADDARTRSAFTEGSGACGSFMDVHISKATVCVLSISCKMLVYNWRRKGRILSWIDAVHLENRLTLSLQFVFHIHRFGSFQYNGFLKGICWFVSVFRAHYHLLNQSNKAQHSYASLQKVCAQICDYIQLLKPPTSLVHWIIGCYSWKVARTYSARS